MDKIVQFDHVSYQYPLTNEKAIKNISFELERGKFYGVIGSNGSGKTTLCSLIRGFAPNFYKGTLEGKILIDGKPISDYSNGEIALKIGYVFQNPFNQISGIRNSVFEEIAYGLENFGVTVNEIEKRVVHMMEKTNVTELAEQNPFDLSGGQQQRVALASILVLNPDILVIDEPTSQLDPESTESVFKIINAMKQEKKTIILVEHKVDLMAEYADEVLVLYNGELIRQGGTQQILSDDSLMDYQVMLPQMSLLGNKVMCQGKKLERIPITLSQAEKVFKHMS